MSDLAVGKNGMPTTSSPVRILRPGDPGFPEQPEETTVSEPKPCGVNGCENPKVAGMGRRYCAAHSDPEARQKAAKRPAGGKKPSAAAKAIASLRAKAAPPLAAPTTLVNTDLRAIAAAYRQAADMLDQAADLLALPT